jgi:protein SCO1/2
VFFGFSSCPHICPNTLFLLTSVVDQLEKELPAESLPQVLFVSVDPERDTPEVLQQYRERFGGNIEAVSGADDQLRALAMDLGSHYVVPEHEPGEWYNVDHSISVHLLDPQARWVALLSPPHDAAAMAEVLERFLGGP